MGGETKTQVDNGLSSLPSALGPSPVLQTESSVVFIYNFGILKILRGYLVWTPFSYRWADSPRQVQHVGLKMKTGSQMSSDSLTSASCQVLMASLLTLVEVTGLEVEGEGVESTCFLHQPHHFAQGRSCLSPDYAIKSLGQMTGLPWILGSFPVLG